MTTSTPGMPLPTTEGTARSLRATGAPRSSRLPKPVVSAESENTPLGGRHVSAGAADDATPDAAVSVAAWVQYQHDTGAMYVDPGVLGRARDVCRTWPYELVRGERLLHSAALLNLLAGSRRRPRRMPGGWLVTRLAVGALYHREIPALPVQPADDWMQVVRGDAAVLHIGFDTEYVVFADDAPPLMVAGSAVPTSTRREIISYQSSVTLEATTYERVLIVDSRAVTGVETPESRLTLDEFLGVALYGVPWLEHPDYAYVRTASREAMELAATRKQRPAMRDANGKLARELTSDGQPVLGWSAYRPLQAQLVGHYVRADASAFRPAGDKWGGLIGDQDLMRRLMPLGRGTGSVIHPTQSYVVLPGDRMAKVSLTVRDTMSLTPGGKARLQDVAELMGQSKGDLPPGAISHMDLVKEFRREEFLEYAGKDATLVTDFAGSLFGRNRPIPATLSSAAAKAAEAVLGMPVIDFRGWVDPASAKEVNYAVTRGRDDVTGDRWTSVFAKGSVNEIWPTGRRHVSDALIAFRDAYHGGLNTCHSYGAVTGLTFDHDIRNAYPTAMAALVDFDVDGEVRHETARPLTRRLTLDDFPAGPVTPMVAAAHFRQLQHPVIGLGYDGTIVYPMEYTHGQTVWVAAPELFVAVAMGAEVWADTIITLPVLMTTDGQPSRSLRRVSEFFVAARKQAASAYGPKSLPALAAKEAGNSVYGRLAQGVSLNSQWNAWESEREVLPPSRITSPYHAAMTTSLVRALVAATTAEIVDAGGYVESITTDGFISAVDEQALNASVAGGIAAIMSEARVAAFDEQTGAPVWEAKGAQELLLNLCTRANVAPRHSVQLAGWAEPLNGVLAAGSYKSVEGHPSKSAGLRAEFLGRVLGASGAAAGLPNRLKEPTPLANLTRTTNREDFHMDGVEKVLPLRYDGKRRPLISTMEDVTVEIEGVEYELVYVRTAPWQTLEEYDKAKAAMAKLIDDYGAVPPCITREVWQLIGEYLGDLAG